MQVLRYEKPERNGDGMECIDLKHTDTINTNVLFPAQLMGGGEILWSFGQRSRLAVRFCAAIIHNVSLGAFFQGFIPRTS